MAPLSHDLHRSSNTPGRVSNILAGFCTAKALARQVASFLFVQPTGVHGVQANDITNLVKFAARGTNLEAQGYNLARIGTHSLRALGAMAFKLQGVNNLTIMKIGWWTGLTFLT